MRKYHSSVIMINLWILLSSVWEFVANSRTSSSVEFKQDSEPETLEESSSKEGFGEEEGILNLHNREGFLIFITRSGGPTKEMEVVLYHDGRILRR